MSRHLTCRQLGSRMKKSVVLVEVTGIMGAYDSVGRSVCPGDS